MYAWNRNGLLRFFPYPENTPLSGGLPCIANVFDDRLAGFAVDYPEIIAASANRLTCFNLNAANANPNAPWWWSVATADPTGIIGVTAFDFDADGLSEIVFRDGAELRILYGGRAPFPPGVDAARNWFSMPAAGKVGDSYPVVADCDGDGQAEIIFTSYSANGPDSVGSLKGRLRVLKADTLAWPGCRNFWNQYGNIGPHIDHDLSIPIQQLEPQRSFALGKRPFNRYGAQIQDLDADFNPYIRVADLNVQVDSSWCGSEKLFAQVRVCNSGALQLPDSVPIRFYRGNPTLTDAPAWGQVQYLPGPIAPGGCVQHIISIPVENGQPYFGMLNDAGTTPRPFLPAGTFHTAKGLECNYADNLFQLSWTWDTPVLDLGPDQKLCTGNALPLDVGPDFSAYRWQDGSTEQFYTAPGPGTYWVDVWDACGFRQTDTLHIAPDPNGQLNLGPDLTICAGDTVMLSVAGFSSVVWAPADAVSCANCPQITLAPLFSLTLTATGTKGNCYATDSVRINVGLFLNVALSSTPSPAGQNSGTAVAAALGGTPPFKFLWNTGATSDSLSGLAPGLYSVIVTDALGCTIAGSVVVEQLVSTQDLEAAPALWVQPNPASREFSIGVSLNLGAEARLYVLNALGQNYWEKRLTARESRWEITCADWPAGLYQVVLESAAGRKVVPIVVAR